MPTWFIWTFLEALSRTGTKVLLKAVGSVQITLASAVLATIVLGTVQCVVGFTGAKLRHEALRCGRKNIVGACAFGLIAFGVTVLSFLIFSYGGDMGVNTFITTLSIIPGGIIDALCFKHPLGLRQWGAMGIALLAGYCVLGAPSLQGVIQFPLWVWLSLITMLGIGVNQGVSQWIKDIDPMVKNFWGGGTQVVLGLITLAAIGGVGVFTQPHPLLSFWLFSVLIGVINVGLWVFNILSYRHGATIALKKLIMNGTHLSTAMIAGVLLFREAASLEKFFGIALFLVAYAAWDQETWSSLRLVRAKILRAM